jgi:hypothetical protein
MSNQSPEESMKDKDAEPQDETVDEIDDIDREFYLEGAGDA